MAQVNNDASMTPMKFGDVTVVDVWQYVQHLLHGEGYEDHKVEVEQRMNGFGVVTWHLLLLDPQHYEAFRSRAWSTWRDMLAELCQWLEQHTRNGVIQWRVLCDHLLPCWNE